MADKAEDCVRSWEASYAKPGLPGGSDGKESACNTGDPGSIPGSGRSPREGNGNPLQYSYLENPMDRGAWKAWGCKESDMTKELRTHTHIIVLSVKINFF